MSESVLIQSRVRELVKGKKPEFRLSEGFLESLNNQVQDLIVDAVARAEKNGRKTLQEQDI